MGFAAEKEKQEKKVRKSKRIVGFCVAGIFVVLCVLSMFIPPNTWKYRFGQPRVGKRAEGEMRVHFVDVGQGDCSIVELPDGKIMLIDGGNGDEKNTTAVIRYLRALKVKTIDYLVVSHADKDHCGGLTEVIRLYDAERIFLPAGKVTENTAYGTFFAALMKENHRWEYSSREINLSTTGTYAYTLQFLYPYTITNEENNQETDDNARSSVIWLDYQGTSTLFTGDAPLETEDILMRDAQLGSLFEVDLDSTEILKVAHHGGADSSSREFLSFLGVREAIISCGENNAYGHPTAETYGELMRVNANIYRTDLDGSIMVNISSNGEYTVDKLGK